MSGAPWPRLQIPSIGRSFERERKPRCLLGAPRVCLLGAAALAALTAGSAATAQDQAPEAGSPGIETGDARNSPRNAIPWLREALSGSEAEDPSAPGAENSGEAPVTDVFGGLFRGSLGEDAQEPPSEPTDRLKGAASVSSDPRYNPRGAAAAPAAIEVARMKAVDGSSAGLFSAEEAGLPINAWRGVKADQAVAALANVSSIRCTCSPGLIPALSAGLPGTTERMCVVLW